MKNNQDNLFVKIKFVNSNAFQNFIVSVEGGAKEDVHCFPCSTKEEFSEQIHKAFEIAFGLTKKYNCDWEIDALLYDFVEFEKDGEGKSILDKYAIEGVEFTDFNTDLDDFEMDGEIFGAFVGVESPAQNELLKAAQKKIKCENIPEIPSLIGHFFSNIFEGKTPDQAADAVIAKWRKMLANN